MNTSVNFVDSRIPDIVSRIEVIKVVKEGQTWGYSIRLYKADYAGLFNIPLEGTPSKVVQLFSKVELKTEKVRKNTKGGYTLGGNPFEVCKDVSKRNHIFDIVLSFGADVAMFSPLYHCFRKGVIVRLNSITIKGKKPIANILISVRDDVNIQPFLSIFDNQKIKIVQSAEGRITNQNFRQYPFQVSLTSLFRLIRNHNYLLCVTACIQVYNEAERPSSVKLASTGFVGSTLLNIKNVDAAKDEVYTALGGSANWGLMLEGLRLNNSLAYCKIQD